MKRKKPINKVGKKTAEWEKVRRNLKVRYENAGITTCELGFEGCWKDNALGFAHAKKRRNLGPGELKVCILACNPCHDKIEILPESEMQMVVLKTIAGRKRQP